ncbi:MAG TPA: helix-turn-helix domain-containing protein [Hyphomicrobiales bacterium]|nr:helix-turn-helix domain-containing protein [Hyphomicrobiales bacterium]
MSEKFSSPRYRQVKGLLRGLEVLEALSGQRDGRASAGSLSTATGIHRTTVKRLLETMRAAGFVRYLEDSNEYCLALRVCSLSEGFHDDMWLLELARPLIDAFTRKVMWPSDFMTLDGEELVVRYTTHPMTPWSFNAKVLGTRIPLLQSAGGRAYLAFCDPTERQRLLAMLAHCDDFEGVRARDSAYVGRLLERCRRQGFALSAGEEGDRWQSDVLGTNRCGALAVPLRRRGMCVASLNLVYLRRAVPTKQAVERYAPELVHLGHEIEARLARAEGGGAGPDRVAA